MCSSDLGKLIETGRITKLLAFRGLERTAVDEAAAGDIVAIAGLPNATVAMTICDPSVETPLPAQPIDQSCLAVVDVRDDGDVAKVHEVPETKRGPKPGARDSAAAQYSQPRPGCNLCSIMKWPPNHRGGWT